MGIMNRQNKFNFLLAWGWSLLLVLFRCEIRPEGHGHLIVRVKAVRQVQSRKLIRRMATTVTYG